MIEATTVVDRVITMLDHQIESVTLSKRPSGDGAMTTTTWLGHVQPAYQRADIVSNAVVDIPEQCAIELYKQDQTVEPQNGDKITVADGGVWAITKIKVKIDRKIFACQCTKDR